MTTIKKLLSATLLVLSSAAVLADAPSAPTTTPVSADEDASHVGISSCLRETGSRLPSANDACLSGSHGKVYGRTQLLTGSASSSAAALLNYDPAIYIHGR